MLAVRPWTNACALGAALALAGCSSLGGGNPFKSASDLDVTFVNASQTWDLDKNGTITCDEWKQYAGGELKASDGDGDGALNATEWSKLTASDRLFETADLSFFDTSGDGRVTGEELTGKPNPAFKMLDKNADCQIGHDEKATVYSNVRVKSKDNATAPPGPGAPGSGGRY
jgi:hypothetical protein